MATCWSRYFGVRDDKDDDADDDDSSTWDYPCSYDRNANSSSGEIMVNISTSKYRLGVFEDDPLFNEVLREAEVAIENEILPSRIYQGSSGSYFVKNVHGVREKLKDLFVNEEPYGLMNPKWAKWFQRQCCPCCFGRGCLVPNSGYLSEAGASLVDLKLGLNVVPKTQIVRMASSTFHYGKIRREAAKAKKTLADKFPAIGRRFHRIGLPLKVGSFQIFVNGYKDAIEWLQKFEMEPLGEDVAIEFQLEFEKLVILDYIIRNTDRGNDNWLLRYDKEGVASDDIDIALSPFSLGTISQKNKRRIKIAAIDNGLAFPFKHPNEWRAYPFQWSKLAHAKIPFSDVTRNQFLPLLSNVCVIESLCSDLYRLFSLDKNFQKSLFDRQMSVLRGQVMNLVSVLRDGRSPFQLVQMPPVIVLKAVEIPKSKPKCTIVPKSAVSPSPAPSQAKILVDMKTSISSNIFSDVSDQYKAEFQQEAPIFTSW